MNGETVTAVLIPAQIEQQLETREVAGFADIQQLADLVIPIDIESRGVTMWLDADDRRNGLPMNLRASSLRWFWDTTSRQRPALHGDVLLVGDIGSTYPVGDVPASLVQELLHGGPYEVGYRRTASSGWRAQSDLHTTYADAAFWAMYLRTHDPALHETRIRAVSPASHQLHALLGSSPRP
ncbi:hypothetical protein [Janibacter sp. GXQ6167]|uniref:hypothetical protein n=1 Tax=Janibacter sp. GXQ6167 TaxID=3240791 RepID=UPI0035250C05